MTKTGRQLYTAAQMEEVREQVLEAAWRGAHSTCQTILEGWTDDHALMRKAIEQLHAQAIMHIEGLG